MISNKIKTGFRENIIIFFAWYCLTIITYGTFVPAGLFLPGMIIGCALGEIYADTLKGQLFEDSDPESFNNFQKHCIVLAIGSMLAGYTRMTYSLAVIVMETSQVMFLFVPLLLTIHVSNSVGYLFTRSLYERAVRGKQMPILVDEVPHVNQCIIAEQAMASNVITLQRIDKVENILAALKSGHHGFPILN